MSKEVVAVDADDVLFDHVGGHIKLCIEQGWSGPRSADDYSENWPNMWGVEERVARSRADIVYAQAMRDFNPIDYAGVVLSRRADLFDFVVLTSRPILAREVTLAAIDRHYPGIFREVYFAGIWDDTNTPYEDRLGMTKGDACVRIGASQLVEDQPKHCLGAAEVGVISYLYGTNPWTVRDMPQGENIIWTPHWKAVGEELDARVGQTV
jgi:hypothetical protein